MKRFARLYSAIDGTTSTNAKVAAMAEYFRDAEPADAAWAIYFLSGGRPKRLIPVRRIAAWAMSEARVPEWLFDECYHSVGDLAETIALLLPSAEVGSSREPARALHSSVGISAREVASVHSAGETRIPSEFSDAGSTDRPLPRHVRRAGRPRRSTDRRGGARRNGNGECAEN